MRLIKVFTMATLASVALAPLYTRLAIAGEVEELHGGAYLGAIIGAASKGGNIDRNPAPGNFTLDKNGASFGVVGGYNWIINDRFMLGLEADLVTAGGDAAKTDATLGAARVSGKFTGSIRARAGVAWNSALFYATAGLAFSDIQARPAGIAASKEISAGLVAGLGLEYALDNDWSARVEGLVYGFGNDSVTFAGSPRKTATGLATVRIGLAKKF